MANSAPIVTIFGGSGFIGRYVAQRMAKAGWRVRVAVRHPNRALFVRPYGAVGQVEPMRVNIYDEASVKRAISGAEGVVNCIGILVPYGSQTFQAVQVEGAERVARLASKEGVRRLVHISAIGADANSDSDYARSKAAGESAVAAAFPTAVILRPSIVYGTEDQFFNRFASMARLSPVLPLVGADTRMQPVYVDDVAAVAAKGLIKDVPAGTYELGGPEIATFKSLMERLLGVIQRRRAIVVIPFWLARMQAGVFDAVQRISGGLFVNRLITRDQVRLLRHDSVVDPNAKGFAELGITPTPMDAILDDYLFSFRPNGQFTEITASARKLH